MQDVHEQPLKRGLFLHPVIQLLFSISGIIIALLLSFVTFLIGVVNLLDGTLTNQEILPFFNVGWSSLLIAGLLLPSILIAIRQLAGNTLTERKSRLFFLSLIGLVLWVPLVLFGQWIADGESLLWLLLPPLQAAGVALPILFWIELGRRKLELHIDRDWSVYSLGVVVVQPLVIVAEIFLLLGLGVLFLTWAGLQPGLLDEIARLGQRLMDSQMDPKLIENILLPYLQTPGVIYFFLAVGAGFIPLLEELLKPLALWVMVGRKFSEREGFMLGLIAGGTFALLESLGMMASAGQSDWSAVLIARLGTGILHVTTTALVGWGLGAAWKDRRYLQLGGLFLLSFALHSIWNLFGLLLGMVPVMPELNLFSSLEVIAPAALVILCIAMLLLLFGANRRLRKQAAQPDPLKG